MRLCGASQHLHFVISRCFPTERFEWAVSLVSYICWHLNVKKKTFHKTVAEHRSSKCLQNQPNESPSFSHIWGVSPVLLFPKCFYFQYFVIKFSLFGLWHFSLHCFFFLPICRAQNHIRHVPPAELNALKSFCDRWQLGGKANVRQQYAQKDHFSVRRWRDSYLWTEGRC